MKFWCIDCEIAFEDEPLSDEYDQSRCPTCERDCLSFEIELEDAKSFHTNGQIGNGIASGLLGGFFGILGVPNNAPEPRIIAYVRQNNLQDDLVSIDNKPDAELARIELGKHGIICAIKETDGVFVIVVEERDRKRAKRLIEKC